MPAAPRSTSGTLPTPALYFAVSALETDGGVQVTGSHNPPEFNGFKMVLGGDAFHGDDILGLWEIITAERWRSGPGQGDHRQLGAPALSRGDRRAATSWSGRSRSCVDCGNGVGSVIAVSTLQALGAEVTPLFCESDGTFPNHHPDPDRAGEPATTSRRRCGAPAPSSASRFDGDADRIGAVDETGQIIWGDQLLVIFGRDAVQRFGPGTPVIFDVKCSEVLPAALKEAGAKPVMWKTGHSLIKAKMKELKAPLAGEMSGHMFFGGDYLGFDDALFAAARLLEIVSRRPFGLATHLADLPKTFATPEIRVDAPEAEKFAIVERAAAALRRPLSGQYDRRCADHLPQGLGTASAPRTPRRFSCCASRRPIQRRWTPTAAKSSAGSPGRAFARSVNRRGRRLIAAITGVVALLFVGRWAAGLLADRWWAAQISPAAVDFLTDWHILRLTLDLAGFLLASAWFIGHLFVVYRAVGSVQVRRNVANLEFREALTPGMLLALAVGAGALLGLLVGTGGAERWQQVALAWQGVTYGIADPLLQHDAGLYVAQLPAWRLAHGFSLLLVVLALGIVFGLYVIVGAVRWMEGRPAINDHARAHLGWLLAGFALTLVWGYVLEPYELVAGLERPVDLATWNATTLVSPLLVGVALATAGLSAAWAMRPRHALAAAGWIVLSLASRRRPLDGAARHRREG